VPLHQILPLLFLPPLTIATPSSADAVEGETPRLVVVISVDQMIPEQLERLAPWWRGGFARFLERGLVFPNAALRHANTETGPGHATLGTGCSPARNGIVENDYFDREAGRYVYCVGDESATTRTSFDWPVAERRSASSHRLLAPGWADLLRERWPASRSVSIGGKDRAVILMAGQRPELALWWDGYGRGFVSSSAYVEELPDWVGEWNGDCFAPMDGWVWTGELPGPASATGTAEDDRPGEAKLMSRPPVFPYRFPELPEPLEPRDRAGLAGLAYSSPWIDRFTLELARIAVTEMELGADEAVDLLAISLSACDTVGHACGPYSREVTDLLLRVDHELGLLFSELDERLGAGGWIAVLSADHGVLELPEARIGDAVGGVRLRVRERRLALEHVRAALDEAFGESYRVNISGGGDAIFFPGGALEAEGVDAARVRGVVARTLVEEPWIAAAYTHDELIAPPREDDDRWLRLARASHRADRGPDVEIRLAHRHLMSMSTGTSHGSPYRYDRRVPLAFLGPGFQPGSRDESAGPMDALPTVLDRLGIEVPASVEGRVLAETP